MKKFLQLFLIIILLVISYVFYKSYINSSKLTENDNTKINQSSLDENKNNIIKNLKYSVKFDNNTQYFISADLSELVYVDGVEVVDMKVVFAELVNSENIALTIKSKKAYYNNLTYNTEFSEDILIEYMGKKIKSDNLDLNFDKNIITIYNNVVYDGNKSVIKTDNIIMDIATKEVKIFMNEPKSKVEILTK